MTVVPTSDLVLPKLTNAQRLAMAAYWQGRTPRSGPHLAKLAQLGLIARGAPPRSAYEPTELARDVLIKSQARTWNLYQTGAAKSRPRCLRCGAGPEWIES